METAPHAASRGGTRLAGADAIDVGDALSDQEVKVTTSVPTSASRAEVAPNSGSRDAAPARSVRAKDVPLPVLYRCSLEAANESGGSARVV